MHGRVDHEQDPQRAQRLALEQRYAGRATRRRPRARRRSLGEAPLQRLAVVEEGLDEEPCGCDRGAAAATGMGTAGARRATRRCGHPSPRAQTLLRPRARPGRSTRAPGIDGAPPPRDRSTGPDRGVAAEPRDARVLAGAVARARQEGHRRASRAQAWIQGTQVGGGRPQAVHPRWRGVALGRTSRGRDEGGRGDRSLQPSAAIAPRSARLTGGCGRRPTQQPT